MTASTLPTLTVEAVIAALLAAAAAAAEQTPRPEEDPSP